MRGRRSSSWNRTRALWPSLIGAIILRDAWICAYCLAIVERKDVEIDHVVTRANGGGNDAGNLVLAHGDCNRWRSDNAIPEGCRVEIEQRIALPVDRAAGQVLGDELYPWAAARREMDRAANKVREARRKPRGKARAVVDEPHDDDPAWFADLEEATI
jgi:hypothetical protein